MHHAVWSGDATIVLQHLDGKVDELEERDNHGCTPLVLAVVHRHLPVLQLLLEAGANPNAPAFFMKERQPLHFAAEVTDEASAPMLRLLLEHGALPTEADADGETALSFALKVGNKAAAEVLAPAAAPLDGADGALHCASAMGDVALVELLLQCDTPVDATDAAGATPLHVACLLGQQPVCDVLLGAGALAFSQNSAAFAKGAPAEKRNSDVSNDLLKLAFEQSKKLVFAELGWGDAEAKLLGKTLTRSSVATKLDLNGNQIADAGVTALADSLRAGAAPKLKTIILGGNSGVSDSRRQP